MYNNINILIMKNSIIFTITYLWKTKGVLLYISSLYTLGRILYSIYLLAKDTIVNFIQAVLSKLYNDGIKINEINPERYATPMRYNPFGKESEGSLLDPYKGAYISLKACLSNIIGLVVDVRK